MRNKINLDFNDVLICPTPASDIRSRTECEVGEVLPLFTAPMDTVISRNNLHIFKDFNICLPRENNGPHVDEDVFSSYGIEEFEKIFLENDVSFTKANILIDVANGHMKRLHHAVSLAKKKYPHMVLMAGNIAHPETFEILQDAKADYVRVGIGNGGGCLTTVQTGVGYPMASLISECAFVKRDSKIIADGGMKNYADIIKALALGADYVMLGSILNRMLESAGETVMIDEITYKRFRGMSSKSVQKDWGRDTLKTSEGIDKMVLVEYTYVQWVSNFRDYLRSAMSYTGCGTLEEFIGGVDIIQISNNAYNRFAK